MNAHQRRKAIRALARSFPVGYSVITESNARGAAVAYIRHAAVIAHTPAKLVIKYRNGRKGEVLAKRATLGC